MCIHQLNVSELALSLVYKYDLAFQYATHYCGLNQHLIYHLIIEFQQYHLLIYVEFE